MKIYPVQYEKLHNGLKMAYRQAGDQGPTVLLIHGNQSSSYFFQGVMEEFEDSMKMYAVDVIGMGDSDYRERNSFRKFAEDVALFAIALNLRDFYVVGWSSGGPIAMELAVMLPERVKKLILTSSVSVKGYAMYGFGGVALPFMTRRLSTREDIEKEPVSVLPVLKALEEGDRTFMKMTWDTMIFNVKKPEEDLYDALLTEAMKQRNLIDVNTALVTFNMTHQNNGAVDGSGRISKIHSEIAIIHGSNDMVVAYSYARENRQYFKRLNPKFYEVPRCGHAVFIDQPDEYYCILRKEILEEDPKNDD